MCGRYTVRATWQEIIQLFHVTQAQAVEWMPRYNIAPTQDVPIVRANGATRELRRVRWGLIPAWAKDEKMGSRMINARAETIAEKPSFRTAFRRRRCLVVTDGFYEWKTMGKTKQPYFIQRADQQPFAFAGLWEQWWGPPEQRRIEPLETCTIITTDANPFMAPLHDRMPVILSAADYEPWLKADHPDVDELPRLLQPYPVDDLQMYPVSTRMNRPQFDDPDCVQSL